MAVDSLGNSLLKMSDLIFSEKKIRQISSVCYLLNKIIAQDKEPFSINSCPAEPGYTLLLQTV